VLVVTGGLRKYPFLSPGLLALLVCCLIVGLVYVTHGRDPLAFVIVGDKFSLGEPAGNVGYDGQFAYYIAVDPLGAPAHLDDPAYRYQRILYPFLARLLALGRPAWVPWTLLFINVVSISASAELVGRMLGRGGLSPYLALIVPLWLGEIFALRADLNEPLCFLLAIVALWWYEREQYTWSAVALAAGALAKDSALLFLPACVLALLFQRRWSSAVHYAAIVVLPYAVLQYWLYRWLGGFGFAGNAVRFELIPFYGMIISELVSVRVFLLLFFALPVTALLILAVRYILRLPQAVHAWALLTNCLFIVFLTRASVVDILALFRLATGVVVAALLFCAAFRQRRLALLLHAIWLPSTVIAVLIPGFFV
jgi:hypothetical protein